MKGVFTFAAGFAAGWLARSTASYSHDAAVGMLAFGLDLSQRMRRAASVERERFGELAKEARARLDVLRSKRAARAPQRVDSAA